MSARDDAARLARGLMDRPQQRRLPVGHASLCVLSFNRLRLISASLPSLAENAGHPFELIVHDDGSSDPELWDYLLSLVARGDISTLILNPPSHNQGQGVALNRMFGMATGDVIVKLDHDLVYTPGWLRDAMSILDCNQQRNFTGDEDEIGLLGLLHYYHDPVDSRQTRIATQDGEGWTAHTHILGSAFAMTRRCWEALGPFEEHSTAFAEDNAMQLKVTASADFVCALPPRDLVQNVGMGYGPSTVNVEPGVTQSIQTGPRLQSRED